MLQKQTIYFNKLKYRDTALVKLYFYDNKSIEQCLKSLKYVRYSQQYQCYYIRNTEDYKKQLQQDVKVVANISTKYMYGDAFNNKTKYSATKAKHALSCFEQTPLVSIAVVNDKAYLKLPYTYKQQWPIYLKELGCIFEAKRRFWMIPNYMGKKEVIQQYFEKQGCKITIKVKHDQKIFSHHQKSNYKKDKELLPFIKIMTLQGAGQRTIDNYACQINKLKTYYPNKKVLDITNNEIIDYLFFLREELGYSTSAQNIVVSAIKRFMQAFSERELSDIKIPRPKHKVSLPKVLEKKEIETMLKLNIYDKHSCMLYLMYAAGIRCGELINLKVEDVDFYKNVIIINKSKGNKSRIVGLSTKMRDLLLRYLRIEQPNIYFFEGQTGGSYSASSVRNVVKYAALKAGIDKRVTPHMLRHSFATHLHDSGMDIRNIQKLLGHSNTKTTEIYTRISKKDISQLKSPLDDLDI